MKYKSNPACEGLRAAKANPRNPRSEADDYVRGCVLANLHARGTLNERMLRAAIEFRETFRFCSGGMAASDFMKEKVDGGRLFIGPSGAIGNALDAERRCREMLARAHMGRASAEVVLLVAGYDMALKVVALEFEEDTTAGREARRSMKPTRQAQDYVRRLLRDGLEALADHLYGKSERRASRLADALGRWLSLDLAR